MLLILYILYAFPLMIEGRNIFITPYQSCGLSCSGEATKPFDNLLIALADISSQSNTTILLLYSSTQPHYILQKEYENNSLTAFSYALNASQVIPINNVLIKPLFCDDALVTSTHSLASQCMPRGEQMIVYLKTAQFTINILGQLRVQDIVFDASEDILFANSMSSALSNCLYRRVRCCHNSVPSADLPISCTPATNYGFDYDIQKIDVSPAPFSLINSDPTNFTSVSFYLESTSFSNFIYPNLKSLIKTGHNEFHIRILDSAIDRIFFNQGTIFHEANGDVVYSELYLSNVSFTNYNPTDIRFIGVGNYEGFFFITKQYFNGSLSIINSSFINTTSYFLADCNNFYGAHNNIFSYPYTRTDLWTEIHNSLRSVETSALIYMNQFDGSLLFESSTFQNIIGTSGSVLHVDDSVGNAIYDINNTIFDGNFAYQGFPNLFVTNYDSGMDGILECPKLNIANSVFRNTYGCPTSYGNNVYLCYWSLNPPYQSTLDNYNLIGRNGISMEPYLKLEDSQAFPYVTVSNSIFENNIIGISNSLTVIGSWYTTLTNNTFRHNGGSSAEILTARWTGSYYATRYPDSFNSYCDTSTFTHFGQSTAVYLDRVIRVNTTSNQYIGNWGSWEGSFLLGECLTLRNWIRLAGTLNFTSDSYINHQGIPDDVGYLLSDQSLKDNVYMSPLITFSYDDIGTAYMYSQVADQSLTENVTIVMDRLTFYNNTLSYDISAYTYNSAETQPLIAKFQPYANRLFTGFIKFLTEMENDDYIGWLPQANSDNPSVGLALTNINVVQNQLINAGCLFPTQWIDYLTISNAYITANQIVESDLSLNNYNWDPSTPGMNSPPGGLFCAISDDTMITPLDITLVANNLTVVNNTGIMFYFARITKLKHPSQNPLSCRINARVLAWLACSH